MLTLQSLQKVSGGLKATVAAMRRMNDALNGKIERFESDKTRSQSFVAENIKAARDEAMPGMLKDLASMREAAGVAEAQIEFWASPALLLSRIPFDPDAATDAMIRLRYAGELASMDLPLLSLTQRNALADGNLALVWACTMAARVSGAGGLADLSAVEIPGQAAALALIEDCDASLAEAEMIVAAMSGLTMDPVRKLTFARRMQPSRPEAHNSPGRPVAA
jgi:hypothetical protein